MNNEPVERYTEEDGTHWIRVWRETRPGLRQLVWATCSHNQMIENDTAYAWKCADCGYVYGQAETK